MRVSPRLLLTCATTALLAGPVLHAAELAVGLQGSIMFPVGDLSTFTGGSVGIGAGTHLLVDLGAGHAIRPRLDFISYPGKTGYMKMQQFSGGADYVYFTEGQTHEGPYAVGGLGLASNTYDTFQPGKSPYNKSYVNPYLGLGLGYQFNAVWGVEVRYQTSRYTDEQGVATPVNSLGLSATVRF